MNITMIDMKSKVSDFADNRSYVLVSDHMTGKMKGIPSVSTIFLSNERCKNRMKCDKLVCHSCYAQGQTFKGSLVKNCTQNYDLLNSRVLEANEFPHFMYSEIPVRIESYGDTGSVIHAANYVKMAMVNPHVTFAAWTKNPDHYQKAFEMLGGKPKNLIMVLSSIECNKPTQLYKKYDWVDHVFTVYTLDYIKENGAKEHVEINCGARSCNTCRRCYKLISPFFINEVLKKDANKYYKYVAETK